MTTSYESYASNWESIMRGDDMKIAPKKTFQFHHNDMDGIGSRIVFILCNMHRLDEVGAWACSNFNIASQVHKAFKEGLIDPSTEVIFTDISPDLETLNILRDNGMTIRVFDHHASALWLNLEPGVYSRVIPKNEDGMMESGTSVLYRYYMERHAAGNTKLDWIFDDVKRAFRFADLVDTIRSYDTFEWKVTGNQKAKDLLTLFSLLGEEEFARSYIDGILNITDTDTTELIDPRDYRFIKSRLRQEQDMIDRFTDKDVIKIKLKGYDAAFTMKVPSVNVSELSYQFLDMYPEYDVFVAYNPGSNSCAFRIRRADINGAEEFAIPLGGGGHPQACGAGLPVSVGEQIVGIVTEYLINQLS